MFTQVYYVIRSRADGQYLTAHPRPESGTGYLLTFAEHFEALSYLNTHAQDLVHQFAVESVPNTQLKGILSRWSFAGIGLVQDPLLPKIEFLAQA